MSCAATTLPVIYLDQNHWIGLLKASEGSAAGMADRRLLKLLRDGVDGGRYTCILSGSHYHETWNRARSDSRHALARLMRDLSKYTTIAPIQTVRLHENMSLLDQLNESDGHLRFEISAPREAVVSRGVNHAFSSETGRFRFVSNVASDAEAEGEPVAPPEEFTRAVAELQERAPDKYEWISLAGFSEHPNIEGFEVFTQRRRGQEFADFRTYFSSEIASRRRHDATNVHRFLLAEFVHHVSEELYVISRDSSSAVPVVESWDQAECMINAMPSCNTLFRLMESRQRNRQKQWEANDLGDLQYLSVAIPYADYILTERQWFSIVRAEKLDVRYRSHVAYRRSELTEALERGWPYGTDTFSD